MLLLLHIYIVCHKDPRRASTSHFWAVDAMCVVQGQI